jgi:transcriptional regulator with XRE-family HTH domain
MLENNKRDPTLSTVTNIAKALRVPIGLLFLLSSEQDDLGPMDEKITGRLMRSALASLVRPPRTATLRGHRHG